MYFRPQIAQQLDVGGKDLPVLPGYLGAQGLDLAVYLHLFHPIAQAHLVAFRVLDQGVGVIGQRALEHHGVAQRLHRHHQRVAAAVQVAGFQVELHLFPVYDQGISSQLRGRLARDAYHQTQQRQQRYLHDSLHLPSLLSRPACILPYNVEVVNHL